MEMNNWNEDFSLGLEWGLDMLDQQNGPFGDLKLSGQPMSDRSFLAHDALLVKHLGDFYQEDVLGPEWMESSDVDSYLDAISGTQDNQDSFLYDCPVLVDSEEAIREEKPLTDFTFLETEISSASFVTSPLKTESDVVASPPNSPAQVAPVINIDIYPPVSYDRHNGSPESYQNSLESTDNTLESFSDRDLSFDDYTLSDIVESNKPLDSLNNISTHNSSPATTPSGTKKSGISIIHSSPELYKVISASAVESVKKSSPLCKSRCGKSTSSGNRKGKVAAQPVPEHIIVEQLNKKDRKKLQNKNAAIRYRQKKKVEAFGIKSEEQILEELNSNLKLKVEDLQREIKYMKNLMDDVCRAKGLL